MRTTQLVLMASKYFPQGRSVVTRSGTQNADCVSLKSKLKAKAEKVDSAPAVVKLEEEEAKVSGNVYVL